MGDVPQFYPKAGEYQLETGTDRALFNVIGTGGEELHILVECVEGTGNVPRKAASLAGISEVFDLRRQLEAAAAMAHTAVSVMKKLTPGALQIEFGIELGGKTGVPLLTQGEAKANFKITLSWKEQAQKDEE